MAFLQGMAGVGVVGTSGMHVVGRSRPVNMSVCNYFQQRAIPVRMRRGAQSRRNDKVSRLRCQAVAAGNKQQMLVYVPPHPLVKHWLAILRNDLTPSPIFRSALAELGRILIYEAARDWLPTIDLQVQTPVALADATIVDASKPVKIVPILRAGLTILEQAATVLPASETYHVGLIRDDETLKPLEYLNKLPKQFAADDRVLVCDPMLATGNSIVHVLQDIVSRGATPEYIRVIAIVTAPPALQQLSDKFPGLKVYTAIIDPELTPKGYISPGLGDAGDRAFGTVNSDQFGNTA